MPKYWGKQIFTHRSFPEVDQKQKMEENEKRPKVGNNNGQLCIATPPRVAHAKPPGPTMACFASSATTGGACKHPWTKIVFFYWKQLGPCSDERRCPCESTKCAGQAFHTFLLPAPIQPPPKSIFGPGGLRAPPVVADESEAGHCVHLFFYIFFYFIFLRLPFFIHFYELWAKLNYCNQC